MSAHPFVSERRQQDPGGVPMCQCGLPLGAAIHQRIRIPAPRRSGDSMIGLTRLLY